MRIRKVFLLEVTILLILSVILIGIGVSKAGDENAHELSSLQLMQITNIPTNATITSSLITQTSVTSTLEISATITLEPYSTVAIIFPELADSATPSPTLATKEPAKGIPLPYIATNNPPTLKESLVYTVIFFWLILIAFTIFVARKIYKLWVEG